LAGNVRVTFAASAEADLGGILAYYAEQRIPVVGQRLVAEILQRIEGLRNHPDRGRVVPEFALKHLRELVHPPFRIVYRRDPGRVRVVRVWRSERLLKRP
jgi:plasmid stabilization system protein ParE